MGGEGVRPDLAQRKKRIIKSSSGTTVNDSYQPKSYVQNASANWTRRSENSPKIQKKNPLKILLRVTIVAFGFNSGYLFIGTL